MKSTTLFRSGYFPRRREEKKKKTTEEEENIDIFKREEKELS